MDAKVLYKDDRFFITEEGNFVKIKNNSNEPMAATPNGFVFGDNVKNALDNGVVQMTIPPGEQYGFDYKKDEFGPQMRRELDEYIRDHELSKDRHVLMNDAIEKIKAMSTEDFVLNFVDRTDKEALKEALDCGYLPFVMEEHEMELSLENGRLEYEGTSMGGSSELYWAVQRIREAIEDISRSSPFIDSINATIDSTYRDLYEGKQVESSVSYSEALDIGDALIQARNPIIKSLIEARGDYFSSDREVAALGYAYKEHEAEIKKHNELEPNVEQNHPSASVEPDMDI